MLENMQGLKLVCVLLLIATIPSCSSKSVSLSKADTEFLYALFDSTTTSEREFHRRVIKTASEYNSYRLQNLRAVLGGLNSLIRTTQDDYFVQHQMSIIDGIVNSARASSEISENVSPFKDSFKGWISLDRARLYGEEIVLNEGYSFFYIAEFLYYQMESGWVKQSTPNRNWWEEKVKFIEDHIWTKWYTRSIRFHGNPHRYFLRGRTHMGSHWAGVAMYLEKISSNVEIQNQCNILRQSYDLVLRRNLRPHPLDKEAYVWNSTYDDVTGTFAIKADESLVQDVSHGNHVVSYIVAAYELYNDTWKRRDIQGLCNTLKAIYKKNENRFSDNVDGSEANSRRGWGNFQADGWIKLSKYDAGVRQIFDRFAGDGEVLRKYNQEFQFRSNLINAISF